MAVFFTLLDIEQKLNENKERSNLSTGCPILDAHLSKNGPKSPAFDFPRLIELHGEAGSGKTQLATQMALNSVVGEDGQVKFACLILTTQKAVHESKVADFSAHVSNQNKFNAVQRAAFKESVLIRHINDYETFDTFIKKELSQILSTYEKRGQPVKCVVIDTITSIVSQIEGTDYQTKFRKDKFLQDFYENIIPYIKMNTYFVVTNNVAGNFSASEYNRYPKSKPALGDIWTYLVSDRFELMKQSDMGKGSSSRLFKVHFSKNGFRPDVWLEMTKNGIFMLNDNAQN